MLVSYPLGLGYAPPSVKRIHQPTISFGVEQITTDTATIQRSNEQQSSDVRQYRRRRNWRRGLRLIGAAGLLASGACALFLLNPLLTACMGGAGLAMLLGGFLLPKRVKPAQTPTTPQSNTVKNNHDVTDPNPEETKIANSVDSKKDSAVDNPSLLSESNDGQQLKSTDNSQNKKGLAKDDKLNLGLALTNIIGSLAVFRYRLWPLIKNDWNDLSIPQTTKYFEYGSLLILIMAASFGLYSISKIVRNYKKRQKASNNNA